MYVWMVITRLYFYKTHLASTFVEPNIFYKKLSPTGAKCRYQKTILYAINGLLALYMLNS